MSKKGVAVFGSTGRLGQISLDLLSQLNNDFEITGLLCNKNWKVLLDQVNTYKPKFAVTMDKDSFYRAKEENSYTNTHILAGLDGIRKLLSSPDVEIVILSVIGSIGFVILLECLKYNKKILLANKEAVVIGGRILKEELKKTKSQIVPLDSEHSSLLRLLQNVNRDFIQNIYITASGGPFFNQKNQNLENITPEEALKHPVWDMGARITIDSATLMNKAFEIIEAKYLFDLPPDRIKVIIHPNSLIHALLELKDGAVLGALHKPDMKVPVLYGLYYPDQLNKISPALANGNFLDWAKIDNMLFCSDISKYKSLKLGYLAASKGHSYEIALNSADEITVEYFLQNKIKFTDIVNIIEQILNTLPNRKIETPQDVLEFDEEIKQKTRTFCSFNL